MEYVKSKVRDVLDFPQKGVVFKDLTTAFKDPRALHIIGWDLSQLYRDKGVTKVVGIESRYRRVDSSLRAWRRFRAGA